MNELLQLNDKLMNAPAGVLVALFAIAIGYVCKISAIFPNKFIPLLIVAVTSFAFPLVQLCAQLSSGDASPFLKIPVNCILGFIIGFLAWAFHAQLLKKYLDPMLFNDDGSTTFLKRDKQLPIDPAQTPKP